jgi:hypothetical protein
MNIEKFIESTRLEWNSLVSLVEGNFNWEGLSEAITDEFSIQYTKLKEKL